MDTFSQYAGASQPLRVIFEEFQIAVPEHGRTGARGDNDIASSLFKDPDGMLGQGPSLAAQPGIESRLPAASLGDWKFNTHAEAIKYMHHRLTNFWKK
jgi:hypothetical protein